MDYKEIYETLNDKQRKKLAGTIDYALVSKLPDCITMFLAMQSVLENDEDLCLNRDQLMLFNDTAQTGILMSAARAKVFQTLREDGYLVFSRKDQYSNTAKFKFRPLDYYQFIGKYAVEPLDDEDFKR